MSRLVSLSIMVIFLLQMGGAHACNMDSHSSEKKTACHSSRVEKLDTSFAQLTPDMHKSGCPYCEANLCSISIVVDTVHFLKNNSNQLSDALSLQRVFVSSNKIRLGVPPINRVGQRPKFDWQAYFAIFII